MWAHEYETLDKHIITQMICKMIDLKNLWAVNEQDSEHKTFLCVIYNTYTLWFMHF